MELTGKHVVISGGTGALGSAVVEVCLAAGAECHVPARSAAPSRPRVHVTSGIDLTDEASVARYYAGLPPLWGSIHTAGGFAMFPALDTSLADLRAQLDINLTSAFLCSREAARRMPSGGRIVNVASRAAVVPSADMLAYSIAKAAVTALTQNLAEELRDAGIWVNAVLPSIMDTPQNRRDMPQADFAKWATTAEVAAAILFLASPGNRVTTGALVPVYGRTV
jgi:NAD(P)-dependent dehydrogenase (short-subunit alcohol dehydrogenase family)